MTRTRPSCTLLLRAPLALLLSAVPAPTLRAQASAGPEPKPSLVAALKGGTTRIELRYRYELVDQEGISDDAHASTLRTTLAYRSGTLHGFDFRLQAENVSDLGAEDLHANGGFGDRGNGVAGRPTIADPGITAMNEAYVRYRAGDTTVRLGRQELLLDDQRFVGNVGWRQHHQSYRAVQIESGAIANLVVRYAYVDRVYRITGATQETDSHLLNVSAPLPGEVATLTAYAYLLDFDDVPALDSNTFGVELRGQPSVSPGVRVPFEVEHAWQRDAAENPSRLRAGYTHVMGGVTWRGLGLRAGWERLDGDPVDGRFETTLATVHAFQGWADKFVVTPAGGIDDLYLRADGPLGPLRWILVGHRFDAATGDRDYGSEVDFQLDWRAPWEQVLMLRGALYFEDGFATDTNKLWVLSTYAF